MSCAFKNRLVDCLVKIGMTTNVHATYCFVNDVRMDGIVHGSYLKQSNFVLILFDATQKIEKCGIKLCL